MGILSMNIRIGDRSMSQQKEIAALESAIYIRDACKHYGATAGPTRKDVLQGLSMEVQRGTIYGLLGPSGCGKTTLLNCIVGRKVLNSGDIWVLGGTPGSEGSGVPGPRIGYMPQDLAVVSEFTVGEMTEFYGRMFGLTAKRLEQRRQELAALLELPRAGQTVGRCSGGQQRRVSLAAAMVHEPELLILDEPTVGLDPVIRERIWEYLQEITTKQGVTVIITTHYIEECRHADRIGLMRQGRIIAEGNPQDLMVQHRTDDLEAVFLKLSRLQEDGVVLRAAEPADLKVTQAARTGCPADALGGGGGRRRRCGLAVDSDRLAALLHKNLLQFFRNYAGMLFLLMMSANQVSLFFVTVGHDPRDVPLALVNEEPGECGEVAAVALNGSECSIGRLSCLFLQEADAPLVRWVMFEDMVSAARALQHGRVAGVVHLGPNFTHAFRERTLQPRSMSDEDLQQAQVDVQLDMSNRQIGSVLRYKLLDAFKRFHRAVNQDCGSPSRLGDIPLRLEAPVYGRLDDEFTVFAMPGFLVTSVYFQCTFMSAVALIHERLQGVWDRNLVAGITTSEVVLSHLLVQLLVAALQMAIQLLLLLLAFGVEVHGSVADVVALLAVQSLGGVIFGFLISALSTTHTMANFICSGSFFITFTLSGVIWPTEAMPPFLQLVTSVFPFGHAVKALRHILVRGWGISNSQVLQSHGISLLWILLNAALTCLLFKRQT